MHIHNHNIGNMDGFYITFSIICTAYISSSKWSEEERKERVLSALVLQEADSIERLVKCLAEDTTHSTHRYMARRLKEVLEKRKQQPECK